MTSDDRETTGDVRGAQPQATASMRLSRYLARAGVDSRRHAESLILDGRVAVNGEVVTTLGTKVTARDRVTVDGAIVKPPDRTVTLMLHKPRDVITAMEDPFGRPTVADLVPDDVAGLFHVGRLDGASTGLLLFTNDGALGHQLVHPRSHVPKSYVVALARTPDERTLKRLREGIVLDGKRTLPAEVELLSRAQALDLFGASAQTVRRHGVAAYAAITLHEGRTRQIRQMFEVTNNEVLALHRYGLGPLRLGDLTVGAWRRLTDDEVAALMHAAERD